MSFSSPIFLWYFMPALLLAYWIVPARHRNVLLAMASLLFYAWGAAATTALLLVGMAVNFGSGILLGTPGRPERQRTWLLGATVAIDLGLLVTWKYAGFFADQAAGLSDRLGLGWQPVIDLALPIGISFYTFHFISYVVDVHRRVSQPQRDVVQFVCYITLFPQLIAGPIVRYHEIEAQLRDVRAARMRDFADGFPRFAHGLFKKAFIADTVAPVADAAFATSGGQLTTLSAWTGAVAYAVQIYFDFSGYSDMAIGLGRMFGFKLPENFDRPYSAWSVTDFWRRWHLSLSRWFRDYLYVPLGGNRGRPALTYRNLSIVFLLTGFWHGASWTFIVWGAFHGGLLIVERAFGLDQAPSNAAAMVLRRAATFVIVVIGWVFFRAPSMDVAVDVLQAMFSPAGLGFSALVDASLTRQREVILLLGLAVALLPGRLVVGRLLDDHRVGGEIALPSRALRLAVVGIIAPVAAMTVAAGTFSPFLYFQF